MEILQIKETCIYVKDLKLVIEFYRDKLGLELFSHVPGKHAFFRAGSSVLLCFNPEDSKRKTSVPPHFAYGDQHFAFEVKEEDYNGWRNKVVKAGIKIEQEEEWKGGFKSFYFRDPEHNSVEFVIKGMWDG